MKSSKKLVVVVFSATVETQTSIALASIGTQTYSQPATPTCGTKQAECNEEASPHESAVVLNDQMALVVLIESDDSMVMETDVSEDELLATPTPMRETGRRTLSTKRKTFICFGLTVGECLPDMNERIFPNNFFVFSALTE